MHQSQVYHAWGNHELYNFSVDTLKQSALFSPQVASQVCHHLATQMHAYAHAARSGRECWLLFFQPRAWMARVDVRLVRHQLAWTTQGQLHGNNCP